MPTVFRYGPYRFSFYSADGSEPPHVHVERDDKVAKVWIDPVSLAENGGFHRTEVNRILSLVRVRERELLRRWHDYFTD